MPTESEIDEALSLVADYAESINFTVTQRDVNNLLVADEESGEIRFRGHILKYGDYTLRIGANPEVNEMPIVHHFSFLETVALELPEEHAKAVVEAVDVDLGETDPRMAAASYLIASVDEQKVREFNSRFKVDAINEQTVFTLTGDQEQHFTGYAVSKSIYPYRDSFSVKELGDAVVAVGEMAKRNNEIISQSIELDIRENDPTSTRLSFL